MEKSIKGTITEKNLLKAFAGESQAKNRYTFFAKQAQKEGYEQIAALFAETALNEEQHAKIFFRFLEGGPVEITATYPAGIIGTTAENLKAAADGELEEWSELYPEFGKIAGEEGFPKVATAFKMIATVEKHHENRYRKLLTNLEKNKVFEKEEKVYWICRKCGYVHFGTKALQNCPACQHPMGYFELLAENY
ncbi:MAG TPA: ferritin family protein [Bacteroidales bacterium]|nr:rubrerythrin family protein [Alphaproteobacteria bacterium]HNW74266.1 ferritin family protein [Bacteroidales bacterium]HPS51633.1 ferritin family protein [Bacteroidales bacterium]